MVKFHCGRGNVQLEICIETISIHHLLAHELFSDTVKPGAQTQYDDPSIYVILPEGQGVHSPGPTDNLNVF